MSILVWLRRRHTRGLWSTHQPLCKHIKLKVLLSQGNTYAFAPFIPYAQKAFEWRGKGERKQKTEDWPPFSALAWAGRTKTHWAPMLSKRIPSRTLNWMLGPPPSLSSFLFLSLFYVRRNRSSLTHADLAFTPVWTCALNQMTWLATKMGQAVNGLATCVDIWLRPQKKSKGKKKMAFVQSEFNNGHTIRYQAHSIKAQEAILKQFPFNLLSRRMSV